MRLLLLVIDLLFYACVILKFTRMGVAKGTVTPETANRPFF
jgi:hypothetical protein